MKISVYIPCYNSERTLEKCIQALKRQSLKPDEIIVINDGSDDITEEIAVRNKVKVISHKENKGIAEARNTALKICKNNLVAGIDSDAIADKDWLKNLASSMKEEKAVLAGGLIEENIESFADKWRANHLKQSWGNKRITNPVFIAGNNFLCSKKEILRVGGYNSIFKTNYEDVEISKRLKESAYKIVYEPEAKVKHLQKDTTKSVLDRHWRSMLHDYPVPDNSLNKIIKVLINFWTSIKFFMVDSFFRSELIFIDLRLFMHHTIKDFKYRK